MVVVTARRQNATARVMTIFKIQGFPTIVICMRAAF
jgi:hypothetical protein